MVEAILRGWRIEADLEENQRFDRVSANIGPGSCDCIYCRNFYSQRREIYPSEVLKFLRKVGVTRPFEIDVMEFGPRGARHLYYAWIPFFGAIKDEPRDKGKVDLFQEPEFTISGTEGRQVIQLVWPVLLTWGMENSA